MAKEEVGGGQMEVVGLLLVVQVVVRVDIVGVVIVVVIVVDAMVIAVAPSEEAGEASDPLF